MIDDFDFGAYLQLLHSLLILAVLVLLGSGYFLIVTTRRDRVQQQRLEKFRGPVSQPNHSAWADYLGNLLSPIVGVVEQQRLQKLLGAAGFKHQSVAGFIGVKAATAISVSATLWLSPILPHALWLQFAVLGAGLLTGWRAPDIVLNRLVGRRRARVEKGIPDALDLLVICAEAGLSLNQSIEEVSRRMVMSNSDVADEFAATSAEMRILPDFGVALDNLVDRTGIKHLCGLVATLKQTLSLGTPLAESLRMIATEMRAERSAKMEERAARLPVLLAIPMMLFILPCLLMIIGTPVALRIMDVFRTIHIGAFGVH